MKKQYTKFVCSLFSIAFLSILFSCKRNKISITDTNDYNKYLELEENTKKDNITIQLQFWNKKMNNDSTRIASLAPIAGLYTQLFDATGEISYLKYAEKTLLKLVDIAAIGKESYMLALSRNYISQHRFKEADKVAKTVLESGQYLNATNMVLFDVAMELGNYAEAEKYLKSFANDSDFNFLIRLAKWNDYTGNLEMTIMHMEKALTIAEKSQKDGLKLWAYTNLADYYGHDGNIDASYKHYLKALKVDPNNTYALRGIAWIVFSYEKKPEKALEIMNVISLKHQNPNYELFKADIAEYMQNPMDKKTYLKNYLNKVSNPLYGSMYDAYSVAVFAEDYKNFDKALYIANQEIEHRPTPQSYDLLAHVLYLEGDYDQAFKIAATHIIDKTYEPHINFHVAQLYKAMKKENELYALKNELKTSYYELGPNIANSIKNL